MSKQSILEQLPENLYRLNLKALLPGDIIASTQPDSGISKAIRFWTKGKFSHVAIYLLDNRLIEATGHGRLWGQDYGVKIMGSGLAIMLY